MVSQLPTATATAYSARRLFTGFAIAAFIAWNLWLQVHNYGNKSACNKQPPTDVDAISISLQPLVHVIPGNGCSNSKGNCNEYDKFF